MGAQRRDDSLKQMTSSEIHHAVRQVLEEVSRRLEAGELDGSGHYYTDEELAAGAVPGDKRWTAEPDKASAA